METRPETVIVPEEAFAVVPDLDFAPYRVARKPRGRGLEAFARGECGGSTVRGVIALLTHRVTGETLDALPDLEVIANCAVGVDNIDLDAAAVRGVRVTNTPGVLTEATADLAWTLILCVLRRVREAVAAVEASTFDGWALDYLLGHDLDGKTLGIIGPGRIGTAVARRGRAFGMEVVYAGRRAAPEFEAATGGRRLALEALLESSHVVSIHVPLGSSTRRLIGARELGRMRRDAVLINTSRGEVVDEAALIRILREGRILGAGLDVFEAEPHIPAELRCRPDVVVTPHIGSATRETRGRMVRTARRNLLAVLRGGEPPNPVG
jgi:glyoxylate reductase